MNEHMNISVLKSNSLSFLHILHSINFELKQYESLGVVGHNGAGKTTLFHVLLGLKFKSTGDFYIQEKKIGYVPERPYLQMEEVFEDFLFLHLNLISFPKSEQLLELKRVAVLVGLENNLKQKFQTFSKGMLQKALLAQAMLGSPKLIFLDEPMSGLDPESRTELKNTLKVLKMNGVSLVFSSHVMDDVIEFADQVLEMSNGKQTFYGSVQEWRVK